MIANRAAVEAASSSGGVRIFWARGVVLIGTLWRLLRECGV